MNETRYIYFGKRKESNRDNVIAVGYKFSGEFMFVTFAFCNAKEDKFERRIAHNIINTRFQEGKYLKIRVRGSIPTYAQTVDVAKQLLKQGAQSNKVCDVNMPAWAKKFALNG